MLKIIKAKEEHIDALRLLWSESYGNAYKLLQCGIENFFKSGSQTTVLALDDDVPVGCATVGYFSMMPTPVCISGKYAVIDWVYVRDGHKGKGIDETMMELLVEEIKEMDVGEIFMKAAPEYLTAAGRIGFHENGSLMTLSIEELLRTRIAEVEKYGLRPHSNCHSCG